MKHSTTLGVHHFVLRSAAVLICTAFIQAANAAEVYKWTDANGQVHFGDRLSAPSNGKKIDVKTHPAKEVATTGPREFPRAMQPISPQFRLQKPSPIQVPKGKSKPVDPSRIGAGCQDLIDQIAKVKPGVNWQSLSQKFDATCPGISYECNTYRTHPENNKCTWIERTGSNVMQTNNYE